jgi:hypothetical protein
MEVGGNIPLVSTIVGVGVLSLDLSSPGNMVNIAAFIVNENDASFTVNWTLGNQGVFKTSGGQSIAMSDASIVEGLATGTGSYVAGTALARKFIKGTPEKVLTAAEITADADGTLTGDLNAVAGLTWTDNQTAATIDDEIFLNASWATNKTALYGLYLETITYTIVAN